MGATLFSQNMQFFYKKQQVMGEPFFYNEG